LRGNNINDLNLKEIKKRFKIKKERLISEERRHYDLSKHLDLILEPKLELINPEVNQSIDFTIIINNNSDERVEFDRFAYWVLFNFQLEGQETHEFQPVGKGYSIFKGIVEPREKKRCKLAFEISHSKVIAICKAMRETGILRGSYSLRLTSIDAPRCFLARAWNLGKL